MFDIFADLWLLNEFFQFSDRKPPGVGRGRGRGGREEGPGGRPAKGIGRGVDDGSIKGSGGGRSRGGPGGRSGGSRGTNHPYLFSSCTKQSKTIIQGHSLEI